MAYKGKKIERGSSRGRSGKVFKAPPIEEVIRERDRELMDRYREQVTPDGSLRRNALKILQAVPMKAAQAGRLALSIAGFGRLRGL